MRVAENLVNTVVFACFFAENLVNIAVFAFFQPGGTLGWRAGGTFPGERP